MRSREQQKPLRSTRPPQKNMLRGFLLQTTRCFLSNTVYIPVTRRILRRKFETDRTSKTKPRISINPIPSKFPIRGQGASHILQCRLAHL